MPWNLNKRKLAGYGFGPGSWVLRYVGAETRDIPSFHLAAHLEGTSALHLGMRVIRPRGHA